MDKNKTSSVKKDKRSWFGKDRKTSFRSCNPNNRYFNGKIKEVQKTFIHQNKEYLEQHNPELLYRAPKLGASHPQVFESHLRYTYRLSCK